MRAGRRSNGQGRVVPMLTLAALLLTGADAPGDGTRGIVVATLDARQQTLHFDGATVEGMTYNGDYAGPVLRVRPGERMQIELINHLQEPTNLHFHGIHTSPTGNSDNVSIVVEPGDRFLYQVDVPLSQPPGLYWYHAHLHGSTERQVSGGLSGALVVEGLAERFPALAGIGEDIFVLKDLEFDEGVDTVIDDQFHGLIQSINGRTMVEARLRPGETRLWRFTNQSSNLYFHLGVEGHRFRVLAEDGITVENPVELSSLDINPASRLEVLVTAGAPGRYEITSYRVPTGSGVAERPNRVLGHLVVEGTAVAPALPPPPSSSALDLLGRRLDARRRFEFSQSKDGEHFFIDGKEFDHTRTDLRVPLGNVEEWTLRNASDDLHVFHIHQVHFQIVEVNGQPQPFNGLVDIARVPERGEIKIRLAFTDPAILGRFVYHCHVLKHEDKGMMANIEVYDPNADSLLSGTQRLIERIRLKMRGLPTAICGE